GDVLHRAERAHRGAAQRRRVLRAAVERDHPPPGEERVRRWPAAALAAALLATGVTLAVVAARGPAPSASMDDRVRAVAETLRCPVCVDLSVADSPSDTAREMRATIRELLAERWSPDRIRDFFVARFGRTILLTPQGTGIDLMAWIAPGLLIAIG